jgi:hypothetical protein
LSGNIVEKVDDRFRDAINTGLSNSVRHAAIVGRASNETSCREAA